MSLEDQYPTPEDQGIDRELLHRVADGKGLPDSKDIVWVEQGEDPGYVIARGDRYSYISPNDVPKLRECSGPKEALDAVLESLYLTDAGLVQRQYSHGVKMLRKGFSRDFSEIDKTKLSPIQQHRLDQLKQLISILEKHVRI